MHNRPIIYIVRGLPDREILYVGQTGSMHRRLYRKRGEHPGLAYYQHINRHYEVIYDQWQLGEQKRIEKEIELTAQLKPHWIYGDGYFERKKWRLDFEDAKHKPYFPMHHPPISQLHLWPRVA